MRVLIAEDDEHLRTILRRMLEAKGFEVVVCSDGNHVLAPETLKDLPQILLLDWMMPGASGLDVVRRLRETHGLPFVYTIMLTARTLSEDLLAGLRAGVNDYIFKPFEPETFESRVRIAVQTVEIHNTMMRQRAEMLAAARLSTLGEMAAGIAHEVRNPLTIIHGQAVMLQKHLKSPVVDTAHVEDSVQKILQTTLRISEIVTGLLQFAGRGTQEGEQEISVGELVERSLSLCGAHMRARGVMLKMSGVDENLKLTCQPVLITQVLVNLLTNAAQAIDDCTAKWIAIDSMDEGERVCIAVTDSGSGVPRELRSKIMQPFFTTKPAGKGVGLGLSIALGIMTSHGGGLWLDEGHENTRFLLWLPKDGVRRETA